MSRHTTLVLSLTPGMAHLLLARQLDGSVGRGLAAAAVETVVKRKSSPCAGVKCTANPRLCRGRW